MCAVSLTSLLSTYSACLPLPVSPDLPLSLWGHGCLGAHLGRTWPPAAMAFFCLPLGPGAIPSPQRGSAWHGSGPTEAQGEWGGHPDFCFKMGLARVCSGQPSPHTPAPWALESSPRVSCSHPVPPYRVLEQPQLGRSPGCCSPLCPLTRGQHCGQRLLWKG